MRTVKRLLGLVLTITVSLAVLACGGPDVGISGSSPLGRLDQLEAFLKEKKLTRQDSTPAKLDKGFRAPLPHTDKEGLQAVKYLGSKPGYPHSVGVIADSTGKVLLICGRFRSESAVFSEVGGRTEASIAKLWLAATGGPPALKERHLDERTDDKCIEAVLTGPRVKGYWLKQAASGDLTIRHEIIDEVVLHLP